jgi:hypothetical protein
MNRLQFQAFYGIDQKQLLILVANNGLLSVQSCLEHVGFPLQFRIIGRNAGDGHGTGV